MVLNTEDMPAKVSIEWSPKSKVGYVHIGNRTVSFDQIKAVFWRQLKPFSVQKSIQLQDTYALLKTFLLEPKIHWVNGDEAINMHRCKPRQLSLLAENGVQIPDTLIDTYSAKAQSFLEQYKSVIVKPVHGGVHSLKVEYASTRPQQLAAAMNDLPCTLQRFIPGTNIRTYVIGSQVFSLEIKTLADDYRDDAHAQAQAIQTSIDITILAKRVSALLKMEWTAIDWRRNKQGEYYFLEANPSPMFLEVERATGLPLTRALIELLLQDKAT